MYKIGEFANIFDISIRTLRYYDEVDLLKPSYIDDFTGYRYYDENKKNDLDKIIRLKELGFTIEEIKEMKLNLTEEKLENKIKKLEKEKMDLLKIIDKIYKVKNNIKVGYNSNNTNNFIGIYININRNVNLDSYYGEVKTKLKKLTKYISITDIKVKVEQEVEYLEEDIDVFIGYKYKLRDKINYKKYKEVLSKSGLEIIGTPKFDQIVCFDIEENDYHDARIRLINYAKQHNLSIVSGFIEEYDKDKYLVSCDISYNEKYEFLDFYRKKRLEEKSKIFINNEELIGNYKIRDVLPNIKFNDKKTKGNTKIKLKKFNLLEKGKTNYDNITWSGNKLYIKNDVEENDYLIESFELNSKKYIEIRMPEIIENGIAISFIYEKID